MSWSGQQASAIDAVGKWLADKSGPQVFRLFGYAGSGKTTLAKHMAEGVDGEVLYAAYTGKAALVLRKKGCIGASTIHSLIYKAVEDPITGHTEFVINPDSSVAFAALIIIDEISMVGTDLGPDLLSFGTKILVLGDPAQLPPVKGEGFFMSGEPDVMLTEIHRQAAENPIIRMSMDIREGRGIAAGQYGDSRVVRRADLDKEEFRALVLQADQMLCGLNRTRQTFNTRYRAIKGIAGKKEAWHPTSGDRLVCLKNNRNKGLLNGGLWAIDQIRVDGKAFKMIVTSIDEPDVMGVEVKVPFEFFQGTEKSMDWRDLKRADQFCHGYALTVHKSQGSQWDNVLLYDESHVFREDAAKHLYTGVTRAAERVTVIV